MEGVIYQDQEGFTAGIQGAFNKRKSINTTYHFTNTKKKKIASDDMQKHLTKANVFYDKRIQKTMNTMELLRHDQKHLIKNWNQKPKYLPGNTLNNESPKAFP